MLSSISMELAHAAFQALGRMRQGKRRQPRRQTIPHYLSRVKSVWARTVGQKRAVAGKRLRQKSDSRKLLRMAQKVIPKSKGSRGGLRRGTWWVNAEIQKLKEGDTKKNRFGWIAERKNLAERYRLLMLSPHDNVEIGARFEQYKLARNSDARQDPPRTVNSAVPYSPFGLGSLAYPLSQEVLDKHSAKSSEGVRGGVQQIADKLLNDRKGDPTSVLEPVLQPCAVKPFEDHVDEKAIRRKRNQQRTCAELHPGLCKKDEGDSLAQTLHIHRRYLAPCLCKCSDHHKGDGTVCLAFFSTDGPDDADGDV